MSKDLKELFVKYQIFIWPTLSILACLLLMVMVLIPQASAAIAQRKQLYDLTNKTSKLITKAGQLESIDATTYQQNVDLLMRILPSDKDFLSAIGQVQQLANANSLKIDDLDFADSSVKSSDTSFYVIKLNFSGGIEQLKSFLNQLKNAPRIMVLDTAELSSTKQTTVYQATLGLKTFYQSLPSNIGSPLDPLPNITKAETDTLANLGSIAQNYPAYSSDVTGPTGKADPFK